MDQKTQISKLMAELRREKRTPPKREYPKYSPGMTAGEYVRRYNALNVGKHDDSRRVTLDFDPDTLARESSTYDPLTPVVTEGVTE